MQNNLNNYDSIIDYDLRQLLRMVDQIKHYIRGNLGLGGLIGDLTFLRDAIHEKPLEWECKLNEALLNLESIYSYSIENKISKDNEAVVQNALKAIEELIKNHPKFKQQNSKAVSQDNQNFL